MDIDGYKEIPSKWRRPSPWKMKSLPKFADVPNRKFNGCPNSKGNGEEPPTPPPSPIMGTFKYPALNRGGNFWPRTNSLDGIVSEIRESRKSYGEHPGNKKNLRDKKLRKNDQLQTLRNYLIDVKPANGETKMRLWSQTKNINF